jgi:hypothetical protein
LQARKCAGRIKIIAVVNANDGRTGRPSDAPRPNEATPVVVDHADDPDWDETKQPHECEIEVLDKA